LPPVSLAFVLPWSKRVRHQSEESFVLRVIETWQSLPVPIGWTKSNMMGIA